MEVIVRSALDKLVSWTGVLVAVVLIVAGGLLTWANVFIGDQVQQQLSDQHITMPEKDALETPAQHAALDKFAGQPLDSGVKAKAYADNYILVHMNAASGGKAYSEVSGEYIAMSQDPNADPKALEELGGLRQTMFMGSTLRGLLLYGYAFATMGTIAGIAAIGAFFSGGFLLLLALLGLRHARKLTPVEADAGSHRVAEPALV
jgi:hypothetical protein